MDLNDQAFMLGDDLAASLAAAGVIERCLDCDPAGNDYHLGPEHTVDELIAAGAEPWTSVGPVSKVSIVRSALLPHPPRKRWVTLIRSG